MGVSAGLLAESREPAAESQTVTAELDASMRIAVDAMGGDRAPDPIVDGAVAAARELGVSVTLVGAAARVEAALARHDDWRGLAVDVADAPEAVAMAEPPATALRRKPRASIRVAAELVASGGADALFSAGHTGATVIAAHAAFGMVPGVDRPALAIAIPTQVRHAVLLDAGATVECRPHHLLQFAVMGSVFARLVLDIPHPRIGLLSIGEEETKGNELTKDTHRLLKGAPVPFIGNVEGREIYSGKADVVVCDGFTGNIVLKTSEGLVEAIETMLREEISAETASRLGYRLSQRAFARFRKRVDYSEYGGAPLLGVGGITIVGHGRSSPRAVRSAIAMASQFARTSFRAHLEREIATATVSPS
jgi:glycerol-3-phosphate acyltransferase PlsX